ncbi:hypothetical protein DV737_g4641, partial [Chaetothyriales sp. CBS 132003]
MPEQVAQPGLQELMAYLHGRNVRKALCTRNFELPVAHLVGKYLADSDKYGVFEPVVTRETEGVMPKPSPEGLWWIARSWGLGARRCLGYGLIMVGDSMDDMRAGYRAGAATVLLVNDENEHLATAHEVDLVPPLPEYSTLISGGERVIDIDGMDTPHQTDDSTLISGGERVIDIDGIDTPTRPSSEQLGSRKAGYVQLIAAIGCLAADALACRAVQQGLDNRVWANGLSSPQAMGMFETGRRPILPAPTDSLLGSADEAPVEADVATDLSNATDRSHQTIPDDGSPITIITAPRKPGLGRAVKSANPSQTSLLIEYFEHGPESGRKPSVRVKVNPSSGRRAKERGPGAGAGHVVVTEAKGDRRPSQSHRIALGGGVDSSVSLLDSDGLGHGYGALPLEIEVNQGSDVSHGSDSAELQYIVPGSDISSMPPDSMLGVLASGSLLSADTRAADARSVRSAQSNVSVNNPKLLQTVEDVIRRLILPELKDIKKDRRHSSHAKTARDRDLPLSDFSESSVSREEPATRRHSSAKSKRRSSRDHGSSRRVSSGSRWHDGARKADAYDTASERSYAPSESLDSVSVEDEVKGHRHRRTHHRHKRDLAHHDSASTLESSRERRKRRSKSRSSRSASVSVAESEEIFHKHGVAPMPMRSEVETELTRSSLLSSNSASTATPVQRERARAYESNLHHQHPIRRGLSPIQSVASYATTEPNRNSLIQPRSVESMRSGRKEAADLADQISIASISSAPSTDLARSRRRHGISLENRNEQRRSGYTDVTEDEAYIDNVTADRQLSLGYGANPHFIHPSAAVESVVASLCEPSTLGTQSNHSPHASHVDSSLSRDLKTPPNLDRRGGRIDAAKAGSPLKHQYSFNGDEQQLQITTNPSVIQGPIAGYATGSRDHWLYDPARPAAAEIMSPGLAAASRDLSSAHTNLIPEALAIGPRAAAEAKILPAVAADPAPLGAHDEGYETGVTAANAPSPAEQDDDDDPFTSQKRREYVSGLSQGMSPLYDSATGRGIDRIKSKDIVALMDHLTVRDAQRSARDTEILMTLVTTAAEMRNSFEDMKKFVADQGDEIMDTTDKQHEKTQKFIGGLPLQWARAPPSEEDDLPARRRNIFHRAFRGLGNKNSQELQHIEAMLMQLLDDVDSLKALHMTSQAQAPAVNNAPRSTSITSADHGHVGTDPGYEPEGQAGTSSTGDRSGIFSNASSRQANYRGLGAPLGTTTTNRVSTVIERDEEYEGVDLPLDRDLSTTPRPLYAEQDGGLQARASSLPVHTPPRLHDDVDEAGALSNDQPSRYYAIEGSSGKKHKSFASSILPKMPISRWSKTTASSPGDYRSTAQTHGKGRAHSPSSQSGTNMPATSFPNEQQYRVDENRPPSPLVPSQVSDNPKYQAHRNSVNLQHPQPRQGPTGRYQNTLETEAQYYSQDAASPTSVTSSQWESQAAIAGMMDGLPHDREYQSGRGANLSPTSNGAHSGLYDAVPQQASSVTFTRARQANGPPRPPKIAASDVGSEPLVPPRPPKQMLSPGGGGSASASASRQATYVDHVTAARAGSPAYDTSPLSAALRSSPGQARKPSGPRPLSRGGTGTSATGRARTGDLNSVKKTRFRGSPYHIDSE